MHISHLRRPRNQIASAAVSNGSANGINIVHAEMTMMVCFLKYVHSFVVLSFAVLFMVGLFSSAIKMHLMHLPIFFSVAPLALAWCMIAKMALMQSYIGFIYIYIYIYRSCIGKINQHQTITTQSKKHTPHNSPLRARYGVSFVSLNCDFLMFCHSDCNVISY